MAKSSVYLVYHFGRGAVSFVAFISRHDSIPPNGKILIYVPLDAPFDDPAQRYKTSAALSW